MSKVPLPPLPLIDGALFIDNSSWMEALNTCHRYLEYKSLRLRISTVEKSSLNFGSAIHLALEHRYKHYKNLEVDEKYYDEIGAIFTEFFAEHPVNSDDWRNLNFAMATMRRYNAKYGIEEFNLLAADRDIENGHGEVVFKKGDPLVEMPFAIPLYTHTASMNRFDEGVPVFYTGKIDLPISIGGQTFILDHKTTGMGGNMFWDEQRMTSQQRGYVWAFEQLTGLPVSGYMIDMIRTKEPPGYVQAGKTFNAAGGKKLTAETWWNESLQRERFLVKPGEIEEWKNNTIDLVEEFFWHYSRGYMPMKTKWCAIYGRCPYYEVCRLAPEDRQMLLASGEFTENKWSPLKKPTQEKQ